MSLQGIDGIPRWEERGKKRKRKTKNKTKKFTIFIVKVQVFTWSFNYWGRVKQKGQRHNRNERASDRQQISQDEWWESCWKKNVPGHEKMLTFLTFHMDEKSERITDGHGSRCSTACGSKATTHFHLTLGRVDGKNNRASGVNSVRREREHHRLEREKQKSECEWK